MSLSLSTIVQNLWVASPVGALSSVAMLVLIVGAFWPRSSRTVIPVLSVVGIVLTGALVIWVDTQGVSPAGMQTLDDFSVVFDLIVLAATLGAVVISGPYIVREGLDRGEYYALMLFSASGAMLMAASDNLIMIFLGLELLSIPLYVLAGFARSEQDSEEAALKYFLLGSFATAFLVFGSALVYAAVGDTSLGNIAVGLGSLEYGPMTLTMVGLGMVLVGLFFKVAVVPFHMWTPDVYQGAPTSVTAFMAVVAKAAGFAALARIAALDFHMVGMLHKDGNWTPLLWGLAAVTMIWGNLIAISQQNIKRLLAYSSIAHAGYLLMGILAGTIEGFSAVLFYLASYAAMILGAFAVVAVLSEHGDRFETLNDYRGAARRSPVLGVAMAVFMFSLAGIPPFAGFFGKLYLFMAAVQAGYVGLTVLAVLTSVVAVFYYLRVTVVMWMEETEDGAQTSTPVVGGVYKTALACLVIIVFGLGVFSSPVIAWTDRGAWAVVTTGLRTTESARSLTHSPNSNPR